MWFCFHYTLLGPKISLFRHLKSQGKSGMNDKSFAPVESAGRTMLEVKAHLCEGITNIYTYKNHKSGYTPFIEDIVARGSRKRVNLIQYV